MTNKRKKRRFRNFQNARENAFQAVCYSLVKFIKENYALGVKRWA